MKLWFLKLVPFLKSIMQALLHFLIIGFIVAFILFEQAALYILFVLEKTLIFFYAYGIPYIRFTTIVMFFHTVSILGMLIILHLLFLRDLLFIFYKLQSILIRSYVLLLVWTYETTVWFLYSCCEPFYNLIYKTLLLIVLPLHNKYPVQADYVFNFVSYVLFGIYLDIFFKIIKPFAQYAFYFLIKNKEIFVFGMLNIVVTVIWIYLPLLMLFKFISLTIIAIITLLLIDKTKIELLKICGLFWAFVIFNCFLFIVYFVEHIQLVEKCSEMLMHITLYSATNLYMLKHSIIFNSVSILYGLDVISLLFLLLTTFLFVIVFLNGLTLEMKELKTFYILIYIIFFFLLNIFLTQNLFVFFFFFESVVFPMFFLIMLGGSRFQKTKAAYYFFFFTVIGSLLMFISINYLFIQFGNLNLDYLFRHIQKSCNIIEQRYLWLTFFLSFAIKIPMFPFHTWLPEAHVEAPTIGSVILAGILLKLGTYGFVRISLFLFPEANIFFSPYVYTLCIISIFYACFIAIRQTDIKRIIAYASVAHMNLIVLGIFSFNTIGIYGSIFQSISHGLVSSGLFILVGMLYNRYKSRLISYYSGLAQVMPIFSYFFLSFVLANISFPLTSNFIGELLLFIGLSKLHFSVLFLSLLSIIVNTIYSLWFCNRILYGNPKAHLLIKFKDVSAPELMLLVILLMSVLILGIFPNVLNIGITQPLNVHLMFLELLHKPYM